jgi:hypothetical protein
VTPEDTAAACAAAVSGLASHFMLDPGTYAVGIEAGFSGLDFYVGGRGGALGDVDGDVVAAAFAVLEPSMVRENWEQARAVLAPRDAAARFVAVGHRWAVDHLPESGVDWPRLAELTARVTAAASPAVAPLFAAWRAMPEPETGDPRALALHRMHVARELRFARHAAAIQAAGLSPVEALAVRQPHMAPIFGWTGELPEVDDDLRARWEAAEAATDRAMAPAYAALTGAEREELASLCSAVAALTV